MKKEHAIFPCAIIFCIFPRSSPQMSHKRYRLYNLKIYIIVSEKFANRICIKSHVTLEVQLQLIRRCRKETNEIK